MTSTPATTSAQKPVLRGLNNAFIKKHLYIALGLTAVATVAYKVLVNDPRKQSYAEFYKKYDAEKSFQRMKAAGVFQAIDA